MRDVKSILQYKNVAVMGLARSGIAAAKKLKSLGLNVFLSDSAPAEKFTNIDELLSLGECEFGGHTEKLLTNDLLIVSPGIVLDHSLLVKAKSIGIPLWSEIELGFRLTHAETKIIAITGSNGKSTTTSLIAHILKSKGKDTILGGNIGDAYCSFDIENKHDFIVLELSSFQLDLIDTFHPNVAVILNITPDHLDRYSSFEEYGRSKFRIIKNLNHDDVFVYSGDCNMCHSMLNEKINPIEVNSKKLFTFGMLNDNFIKNNLTDIEILKEIMYVDATIVQDTIYLYSDDMDKPEPIVTNIDELPLKGPHNFANIMAALLSVKEYIDFKDIFNILKRFPPLEHRLELFATHNGVEYYNDSKATNTDSVKFALQSFTKPIHLILGGSDKGEDFSVLSPYLESNVKKLYLIGNTADKLETIFKDKFVCEKYTDFESVIKATIKKATSGDVVLLSPACASFDWFKNYEHRGREFKRIVLESI